jgi:hypothetical protein
MPRVAKALPDRFHVNRSITKDWLYYFSELYQQGYAAGVPGEEYLRSMRHGPRDPLATFYALRLNDPDTFDSHRVLMLAVRNLRDKHPRWHTTIAPVYFWENANPALLDAWHDKRNHGETDEDRLGAQMAITHHREALDHMARFACRWLPRITRDRREREGKEPLTVLQVNVPAPYRGKRVTWKAARRRKAWRVYCELRSDNDRADAIKKGAKQCSYSVSEFRAIVAENEDAGGEWTP